MKNENWNPKEEKTHPNSKSRPASKSGPNSRGAFLLPGMFGHSWIWYTEATTLYVAPLDRWNWRPLWNTQRRLSWYPPYCLSTGHKTWVSTMETKAVVTGLQSNKWSVNGNKKCQCSVAGQHLNCSCNKTDLVDHFPSGISSHVNVVVTWRLNWGFAFFK